MTNVNGSTSSYNLLIVGTDVVPISQLVENGEFTISRVETHSEISKITDSNHDAILATMSPDIVSIYEIIQQSEPETQRPLLCIIGDQSPQNYEPVVDVYLSTTNLIYQLRTYLHLRGKMLKMQNENNTLSSQVVELENRLKEEQKLRDKVAILKNAIVRNVSHELKTPLLQVKSAVALLAEDIHDEKLIEYATGATGRLEAVVKNITMLGDSLEINPGPVIVREAFEFARRHLSRIWEQRNHIERVKSDIPSSLPPIIADKHGVSTVLQLLIDNALKFSEGEISVRAELDASNGKVIITVEDQGIGIDESQIHAIFDTFYQIDASSTRHYGGTGVGLAIVKLILDNHGSKIRVVSRVGKGSRFIFDMPIAKMD